MMMPSNEIEPLAEVDAPRPSILQQVRVVGDDGQITERYAVRFPPGAPLLIEAADPGPFEARPEGWSDGALQLLALVGLLVVAAVLFTATFSVWYGLPIVPLILFAAEQLRICRHGHRFSLADEGTIYFVRTPPADAEWENRVSSGSEGWTTRRLMIGLWGLWLATGALVGPFSAYLGVMGAALGVVATAGTDDDDDEEEAPVGVRTWVSAASTAVFVVAADLWVFKGITPLGVVIAGAIWLVPKLWREVIEEHVPWKFGKGPGRVELVPSWLGYPVVFAMLACFATANLLEGHPLLRPTLYLLAAFFLMLGFVTVEEKRSAPSTAAGPADAPRVEGGSAAATLPAPPPSIPHVPPLRDFASAAAPPRRP